MRKLTMSGFIKVYNAVLSYSNGYSGTAIKFPNTETMTEISLKNDLSIHTIRAYVGRFRSKYNITDVEHLNASKFTEITGLNSKTFNSSKIGLIRNKSRGSKKDLIEKFKLDVIGIDKTLECLVNEFLDDLGSETQQVEFIKSHSLKRSIEEIKTHCAFKIPIDTIGDENVNSNSTTPNVLGTIESNIAKMEEVLATIYTLNDIKSLEELESIISKYKKSVEIRDGIMVLMDM